MGQYLISFLQEVYGSFPFYAYGMTFIGGADEPGYQRFPMRYSKRPSGAMDICISDFVEEVGDVKLLEFDFLVRLLRIQTS